MDSKRTSLSKSILDMKFMKRTKDKVEKQQFQKEGEDYFGNQITTRMRNESNKFMMEPSYVFCERLTEGRLSFQGMNPLIEKLMEARENEKRAQEELRKETDVSDEQMTVHWQKMRAKFDAASKNKPHREEDNKDEPVKKKPKFLKPID